MGVLGDDIKFSRATTIRENEIKRGTVSKFSYIKVLSLFL